MPDVELLGDRGFAQPFLASFFISWAFLATVRRAAVGAAFFSGLGDPGLHAIAQDVPLEFGEHRQHAGQRPATRRRQVQRLAQVRRSRPSVRSTPATSRPDRRANAPSGPAARPGSFDLPPPRRPDQILAAGRRERPNQLPPPSGRRPIRASACARMAESCKGNVCWSWVETRA